MCEYKQIRFATPAHLMYHLTLHRHSCEMLLAASHHEKVWPVVFRQAVRDQSLHRAPTYHNEERDKATVQVKGVATTTGARPWQETDLEQATWNRFLKVWSAP